MPSDTREAVWMSDGELVAREVVQVNTSCGSPREGIVPDSSHG